jgi:hypothetical protein
VIEWDEVRARESKPVPDAASMRASESGKRTEVTMAPKLYSGQDGVYAVDWEILIRICRSYACAMSTFNRAKISLLESHFIGPTIYTVTVDWTAVHRDVERDSPRIFESIRRTAQASMPMSADAVRQMVNESVYYRKRFADMQRWVTHTSMSNLQASVGRLGTTVQILKRIRDASAEFVMVTGGFISGGAALAAVGTGALLKGTAKWEDSHSLSAGVATASTEMLFNIIPVSLDTPGASVVKRQVAALLIAFAKVPADMYVSALEGEGLRNGILSGAIKFHEHPLELIVKQFVKETTPDRFKLCAILAMTAFHLADDASITHLKHSVTLGSTRNRGATAVVASHSTTVSAPTPRIRKGIADLVAFHPACVNEYGICKL